MVRGAKRERVMRHGVFVVVALGAVSLGGAIGATAVVVAAGGVVFASSPVRCGAGLDSMRRAD